MIDVIRFFRNEPYIHNIGDLLCCPAYYFSFGAHNIEGNWFKPLRAKYTVLGGGAFKNFGLGIVEDQSSVVAWGLGSSIHGLDSNVARIDELPYGNWGVRDIDSIQDDSRFVPCVSCLHEMLDSPPGKELLVFLNRNSEITKDQSLFVSANVYTNALNEKQFSDVWLKSGSVITNSYHVAYWSLLSGRKVSLIGYSSKFRSLYKALGLPLEMIIPFTPQEDGSLGKLIQSEVKLGQNAVFLPDHKVFLEDYRRRNICFAEKSHAMGLLPAFGIKTHHLDKYLSRHLLSRMRANLRQIRNKVR